MRKTKVGTPKIDGSKLYIFDIVIAFFLVEDKEGKLRFFEKTFLLANISMNIALEMLFLILSNIEIDFTDCYLN